MKPALIESRPRFPHTWFLAYLSYAPTDHRFVRRFTCSSNNTFTASTHSSNQWQLCFLQARSATANPFRYARDPECTAQLSRMARTRKAAPLCRCQFSFQIEKRMVRTLLLLMLTAVALRVAAALGGSILAKETAKVEVAVVECEVVEEARTHHQSSSTQESST